MTDIYTSMNGRTTLTYKCSGCGKRCSLAFHPTTGFSGMDEDRRQLRSCPFNAGGFGGWNKTPGRFLRTIVSHMATAAVFGIIGLMVGADVASERLQQEAIVRGFGYLKAPPSCFPTKGGGVFHWKGD